MTGPHISDHDFFHALDLDQPELAAVRAAAVAEDWPAAEAAFAAHVRQRQEPRWFFDWRESDQHRDPAYDTAAAERIVKDVLESCNVPYDFSGGEIDWELNPIDYKEWTWQLSRHPFWVTLGEAYWATGDERYAAAFVRQMLHWVAHVPRPEDSGNPWRTDRTNCWRTIECGIRMAGSWPNSFFYFLSSPSFTDDAIIDMVKSMVEHARYLALYPTTGNWLTMECNGLYHVGALFPEFQEAAAWRDTAVARLHKDLDVQVYPDGAQIELAPGYHQVSLYNFLGLVQVAQLTGQTLPADYLGKLERMWEYNMWLMGPDGASPAFNDSGPTDLRRTLGDGLKYFPGREDWKWITTRGAEGKPPAGTSHACPWAGQYIMRSGWGPDDLWCVFEAGPFGYGHQHEDKLGFVMNAYGSRLVMDTGVYTYDASDWRRYVLGATAHSTVFVDGKGQVRRGAPRETFVNKQAQTNPWFTTEGLDYAVGTYDEGFGKDKERLATQRREIVFIKPDYWLVIDTLTPADAQPHDYTAYFHLRPVAASVVPGTQNIVTDNGDKANLAILPIRVGADVPDALAAQVIQGQKEPFLLGWTLKSGLECEPIPVATYRWQASAPSQIAYVFFPLKPGAKELPVVTAIADGLSVKVGERVDEIKLGDKPRLLITRRQGDQTSAAMRVELP